MSEMAVRMIGRIGGGRIGIVMMVMMGATNGQKCASYQNQTPSHFAQAEQNAIGHVKSDRSIRAVVTSFFDGRYPTLN
jgi:hypothetical protein